MILLALLSVLIPSCSKYTAIGGSCACSTRIQVMQSTRFLAKRLTDLVRIMSKRPSSACFIMSWNAGLCSVFVPEKPSSTYVPK